MERKRHAREQKSQVCVWQTATGKPRTTKGIPRGVGEEKRRKCTSFVHKLANELRVQSSMIVRLPIRVSSLGQRE